MAMAVCVTLLAFTTAMNPAIRANAEFTSHSGRARAGFPPHANHEQPNGQGASNHADQCNDDDYRPDNNRYRHESEQRRMPWEWGDDFDDDATYNSDFYNQFYCNYDAMPQFDDTCGGNNASRDKMFARLLQAVTNATNARLRNKSSSARRGAGARTLTDEEEEEEAAADQKKLMKNVLSWCCHVSGGLFSDDNSDDAHSQSSGTHDDDVLSTSMNSHHVKDAGFLIMNNNNTNDSMHDSHTNGETGSNHSHRETDCSTPSSTSTSTGSARQQQRVSPAVSMPQATAASPADDVDVLGSVPAAWLSTSQRQLHSGRSFFHSVVASTMAFARHVVGESQWTDTKTLCIPYASTAWSSSKNVSASSAASTTTTGTTTAASNNHVIYRNPNHHLLNDGNNGATYALFLGQLRKELTTSFVQFMINVVGLDMDRDIAYIEMHTANSRHFPGEVRPKGCATVHVYSETARDVLLSFHHRLYLTDRSLFEDVEVFADEDHHNHDHEFLIVASEDKRGWLAAEANTWSNKPGRDSSLFSLNPIVIELKQSKSTSAAGPRNSRKQPQVVVVPAMTSSTTESAASVSGNHTAAPAYFSQIYRHSGFHHQHHQAVHTDDVTNFSAPAYCWQPYHGASMMTSATVADDFDFMATSCEEEEDASVWTFSACGTRKQRNPYGAHVLAAVQTGSFVI